MQWPTLINDPASTPHFTGIRGVAIVLKLFVPLPCLDWAVFVRIFIVVSRKVIRLASSYVDPNLQFQGVVYLCFVFVKWESYGPVLAALFSVTSWHVWIFGSVRPREWFCLHRSMLEWLGNWMLGRACAFSRRCAKVCTFLAKLKLWSVVAFAVIEQQWQALALRSHAHHHPHLTATQPNPTQSSRVFAWVSHRTNSCSTVVVVVVVVAQLSTPVRLLQWIGGQVTCCSWLLYLFYTDFSDVPSTIFSTCFCGFMVQGVLKKSIH